MVRKSTSKDGRPQDGNYPVVATIEKRCVICGWMIGKGDLIVRVSFGEWVHDRCS